MAYATVLGLRSTGAIVFLALRLAAFGLATVELETFGEGRCGGITCVIGKLVEGDGSELDDAAATRSVGTFSTVVDRGAATGASTCVADGSGDGAGGLNGDAALAGAAAVT